MLIGASRSVGHIPENGATGVWRISSCFGLGPSDCTRALGKRGQVDA
jgi:hypothetical protein